MQVRLEENAPAASAMCREIRTSTLPTATLAPRHNCNVAPVRSWCGRADTQGALRCPRRLQSTHTPARDALLVQGRRTEFPPLDVARALVRDFIKPGASRSGSHHSSILIESRRGVSWPIDLRPEEEQPRRPAKEHKDCARALAYVPVKYPQQSINGDKRAELLGAVDQRSRWVYLDRLQDQYV